MTAVVERPLVPKDDYEYRRWMASYVPPDYPFHGEQVDVIGAAVWDMLHRQRLHGDDKWKSWCHDDPAHNVRVRQLAKVYPELKSLERKRYWTDPSSRTPYPEPGKAMEDERRLCRRSGSQPEGASAGRYLPAGVESGSLLDLHVETGGCYRIVEYPDRQLDCKECGQEIGENRIERDSEGLPVWGRGGQFLYCSDRCKQDAANRRGRYRRDRVSGRRRRTGEVPDWVRDDPALAIKSTTYGDPSGDAAVRHVLAGTTEPADGCSLDCRQRERDAGHVCDAPSWLPKGKREEVPRRIALNSTSVFDKSFHDADGEASYRRAALCGQRSRWDW